MKTIAVTTGDPAGIGPEISIRALNEWRAEGVRAFAIGSKRHLLRVAECVGQAIKFEILDISSENDQFEFGIETAGTGRASADYIEKAVDLWKEGEVQAIATAPISKHALELAAVNFPGHTEFLAHLTDTPRVAMSFFAGDLITVLLSTHKSLTAAIADVTQGNLINSITFADNTLKRILKRDVKIAVAGLNPHASENGLFGSEESAEIVPAIEYLRKNGIDISGPYSADTIFLRGYKGEFDAVFALYHDQATVAVKCLSFGKGVNVTLGLPLIRTSVDHGTAFDIAGKGIADHSSMLEALNVACKLLKV